MTMRKVDLEQVIKEDLYSEAEAIQKKVDASGTEDMPGALKDDIWLKLKDRIDTYEEEKAYAGLSEKDREALELGRKLQAERAAQNTGNNVAEKMGSDAGNEEKKAVKKRFGSNKLWKVLGASAAAIMLVFIVGMTSMGGPERIASMIEQVVGGRKVVQVDSDDENKVSENEDEQKAYQEIEDTFGIEPVKIEKQGKGIKFIQMNLDNNLQIAEMLYQYGGENLLYIVSAGYYNSSFGFDADDEIVDKEIMSVTGNDIDLTIYQVNGTETIKCLAHFTYQNLEYFLVGNIDKEEFKEILKNLS